jgi:hypothetical protein
MKMEALPARKNSFLLLALIFILLATLNSSANAWEKEAHRMILRNTLDILPEQLKQVLTPHLPMLLSGVVEPDLNRVDDHKLYLYAIRGKEPGPGGAHFALDRFARKAEAMIKAGEPINEIAFMLGQAAHFIQDVNVPLHTIWGETREQHVAYEGIAYFEKWPGDKYGYDGFYLVKKYKGFAFEAAKRSHRYFDSALRNPPPSEVIEKTWNDSVNDTANLWQSIFYRALGPQKSLELYGIPLPKGEKEKGWLGYLQNYKSASS